MKPSIPWIAAVLIYSLFFAWYTNLSGPLTPEEIERQLQRMEAGGADRQQLALITRWMETDTGDDFVMVNLLDMNESPPELPATGPDAPASALLDHYMAYMYPELLKRASHPVFFGRAVSDALDISGIEGAEHWETGALMRYRSRRDMLEIAGDPRFNERHDYKLGALTKTIAFPVEPMLNPADPRLLLALFLTAAAALMHLWLISRNRS